MQVPLTRIEESARTGLWLLILNAGPVSGEVTRIYMAASTTAQDSTFSRIQSRGSRRYMQLERPHFLFQAT